MGNIAATMNPQRVRMLQQPDNDEQFQQPLAESKPSAIRVTGANVLALSEHSSISNRLNQSRAEPRSSAIPTKRSYSDFENDKDYQDEPRKYDRYRPHQNSLKYDKRLERQVPPLFPPGMLLILRSQLQRIHYPNLDDLFLQRLYGTITHRI